MITHDAKDHPSMLEKSRNLLELRAADFVLPSSVEREEKRNEIRHTCAVATDRGLRLRHHARNMNAATVTDL